MKTKKSSPWARLKVRLSKWKDTAKHATRQRRRLRDQLRYYQQRTTELEQQLASRTIAAQPQPVFNCHYPAQMMTIAIVCVLSGGSLRCAAAVAGCLARLLGWNYGAPAFKTVSNWVERCGLHALHLSQSLEGHFVGIVEASIEVGKEQLLLLLGVRAELLATLDRPSPWPMSKF